jgi:hypothetical protein
MLLDELLAPICALLSNEQVDLEGSVQSTVVTGAGTCYDLFLDALGTVD